MTTRIYLIRHGATQMSAEDRFAGATDVPLSDVGREQARGLSKRLGKDPVVAVYCSPMKRTIETAQIIAEPHGLTPIAREELSEINHGHWETMLRSEVESQFGEEYAAWEEDPYTFAPEGGESGISLMARALPTIRELVERHENQNVVVVSHKATIRLILCSFLGIDARGYRDRLDQSPASLNALDFKDAVRARLMLYNDISHYEDHPTRPGAHLSKWWGNTQT